MCPAQDSELESSNSVPGFAGDLQYHSTLEERKRTDPGPQGTMLQRVRRRHTGAFLATSLRPLLDGVTVPDGKTAEPGTVAFSSDSKLGRPLTIR